MTQAWAGVELRHLTALLTLAQEGSFSQAAQSLGYTQSAVSQQIARLERLVGHRLVDRPGGPRAVSLTPAGQVLLRYAGAVRDQLARAAADLAALSAGTAGTLRIGCFQSVGVRILPRVLSEFAAAFPQVTVRLTEAEDDGELLHQLEHGELDLTFVAYPMMPGPFETIELLTDPYVVVVRQDHPLARQDTAVELRTLADLPLVTYAQMREVHSIENRLGRPELTDQIVFRSNDNGAILGLAAEGVGAAVVSWLSVDPHREGVRTLALRDVSPRIVGIAWHAEREPLAAAQAFVRIAQTVTAREQAAAPGPTASSPAFVRG